MKILVTGGAGFIGSFLCRELLRRGNNVVAIDNFSNYYSKRAKTFNLDLTRLFADQKINSSDKEKVKEILDKLESYRNLKPKKLGKFKFIKLDIRDKSGLEKLFKKEKFDKVVHLAAMAGVPYSLKKPLLYTNVNVDGTQSLLEASEKHKIKKFIFISSSSVYGETNQIPFKENQNTDNPISFYAATKRMGEIMCFTYNYLYKLPIIIIRMFGPVYGPLQRPYGMAAQRFIRQVDKNLPITVYGDGSMKRDCTYIDDQVSGIIKALDSKINFETFNIGSGKPISVIQMAKLTLKHFAKGQIKHAPTPLTEISITYSSIEKSKKLLKFDSKIKYEEGLKRQIEIYKLMPQWYKNLKV